MAILKTSGGADAQSLFNRIGDILGGGQLGFQGLSGAGLFIDASATRYLNEIASSFYTETVVIEGTDLKYNAINQLVGGTITSIAYSYNVKLADGTVHDSIAVAQDLSISAAQVYSGTLGDEIVAAVGEEPQPVFGTDDADALFGNPEPNTVIGLGGDDTIITYENDDVLIGGEGNDSLDGGTGNDQLFGENGIDQIFAGEGDDVAFGGAGDDLIVGDAEGTTGDDGLFGEDGNDVVYAGLGNDYVSGGNGNDILFGETGNDEILGGEGNDTIIGGTENDLLLGENGDDVIDGGIGTDTIFGGYGNDLIFGGDGIDAAGDALFGEAGDDVIRGGSGNDFVLGGLGTDVISTGAGADIVRLESGSGFDFWQDFEDGVDVIDASFIAGAKDQVVIAATLDGTGTYIGFDETQLVLEGVDFNLIGDDDFIFEEAEIVEPEVA